MHRVLATSPKGLCSSSADPSGGGPDAPPAQLGSSGLMPGGALMQSQMLNPKYKAVADVRMHPTEIQSTASFASSVGSVVPAADSSLLQSADVAGLQQWRCTLWEGLVWRSRQLPCRQ